MEEKKVWTFEEFMAAMEENGKKMAETMKGFAELRVLQEENARGFAELRELQKKNEENSEKSFARVDKAIEKMSQEVRRLNNTVNGVSKSNGMMAEEFFYNSLKSTKTFGGVRFDKVKKNLYGNASKEGENLEGEYDITMINGDSLCIVETKYRVRPDDVSDLVKRRLIKFRELLPKYAGYKIYLGIGGMSFENDKMIEKKAKDFGVGILKLNGDVVEIYDKNLKVY